LGAALQSYNGGSAAVPARDLARSASAISAISAAFSARKRGYARGRVRRSIRACVEEGDEEEEDDSDGAAPVDGADNDAPSDESVRLGAPSPFTVGGSKAAATDVSMYSTSLSFSRNSPSATAYSSSRGTTEFRSAISFRSSLSLFSRVALSDRKVRLWTRLGHGRDRDEDGGDDQASHTPQSAGLRAGAITRNRGKARIFLVSVGWVNGSGRTGCSGRKTAVANANPSNFEELGSGRCDGQQ
jgi:hypothetical protein